MNLKTLLLTLITSISLTSFTYADSKIEESQLEQYELIEIGELPPLVDLVVTNSAAEIAGIKSKDKMLRVNGVPTNTWGEWKRWVEKSPNQDIQIQVERNKKIIELVLTPEDVNGIGRAGVSLFIPKSYYEQFVGPAEQGNTEAQNKLGYAYFYGNGFKKDYKKSFYWFQKAAEQGDQFAQNELGEMYASGVGVLKDDKQAVNWYRKAAEQGDSEAQYNLGIAYLLGKGGVTQDYKQAFNWFKKAAEQGDSAAQYGLGLLYYLGDGVEQSYKEAFSLFQLSKNLRSKGQLAVMYAEGKGISKDLSKAKELLQEIFNNGSKYEKNRAKKAWERYNLWEF